VTAPVTTPPSAPVAVVDEDTLEQIASVLNLRTPNRDAVLTVAHRLADHHTGAFEGVLDLATGVGKTYCIAALIDYLVETAGVRNFVIVTPGRTILNKTIDNFTPSGRKSLVDKMSTRPNLVTADNHNTPDVRRILDDPEEVKVFVFTVQSLIAPRNEQRRRLHRFQEGIGERLYEYLQRSPDLVVLADEHHCYYGPAFSSAIREMQPYALIGLTATPHRKTPETQIVYRYPLAHAIAERYVKTPVIVGRTDDRSDPETKLRDGLALLAAKDTALARHCDAEGLTRVHPLMLVVAPTIEEAKEVEELLADPGFHHGEYAGAVLRIDSSSPDESLSALEWVEDAASPVRVIVSVGMLKEGWDVANVFVIVSLRASVSDILTEQTLGRGLRLPFGEYTGVELLDTLEVVAHERYEDLLRQARVLKEKVVDWRSHEAANAVPEASTEDAPVVPALPPHPDTAATTTATPGEELELVLTDEPTPVRAPDAVTATTVEARTAQAQAEAVRVAELHPRQAWTPLRIPVVESVAVPPQFSLLDVTDMEPFRAYGRRLAVNPSDELRRSLITATMRLGPSGIPEVDLTTRAAQDRIHSQGTLLAPEDARNELLRRLLAAPQVPPTASQVGAAVPMVEAFLDGLGDAVEHLGAWLDQAAGGLIQLVQKKLRESVGPVVLSESVRYVEYAKARTGRPRTSQDVLGEFTRGVGYTEFRKSLYAEDWFDSRPERDLANIVDQADSVVMWLRLQRGDLTILWRGQSSWYSPDFLVREQDGASWIVEVKADRDMDTADVQAKKDAADRWARRVTADGSAGVWRYLLVSETQLRGATGDWRRLKALHRGS
jgi:type III restriction enzyme